MFTILSNSGKPADYITEYLLDTAADVANLPTSGAPGSKAFVIEDSTYYMLNHAKTWVKVNLASGGGGNSGGGEIIYDGGVEL